MAQPAHADARERALAKLLPGNALLAAVPQEAQSRLLPHLGLVNLRPGPLALEQGGACVRVFFPLAGLVAVAVDPPEAMSAPALVGREGMLGLPANQDDGPVPADAFVLCEGYGLALGRERFVEEWNRGEHFRAIVLAYGAAVRAQEARSAFCRREHGIEQQLCSLLRLSQHGLGGAPMAWTADSAARALGVSRDAVVSALRHPGTRGAVAIRPDGVLVAPDAAALLAGACGCQQRVRAQWLSGEPDPVETTGRQSGQARINASISSALTGTPREINSQPAAVTMASSSIRMPML